MFIFQNILRMYLMDDPLDKNSIAKNFNIN